MNAPWTSWEHSAWQSEWEKFRADEGPLPQSLVPTGLELESALRRELQRGNASAAEPLALWLAFRGRASEALPLVAKRPAATARRVAGLILWRGLGDARSAVAHLEAGPLHDPIAMVELDTLYTELGLMAERVTLLARPSQHRFVIERRADLALALGQAAETPFAS